jgi:hypothetical protein
MPTRELHSEKFMVLELKRYPKAEKPFKNLEKEFSIVINFSQNTNNKSKGVTPE